MTEELASAIPFLAYRTDRPAVLLPEALPPAQPAPPADARQVQALDTVFAQEPEKVAGTDLLGLWASAALFAELARDDLRRAIEDAEAADDEAGEPPDDEGTPPA